MRRHILFALATLAMACSPPAGPSDPAEPPPAVPGQCSYTADGFEGARSCPEMACDGRLVESPDKLECFVGGRLVRWRDTTPDGAVQFEPQPTGLGDGIVEHHCGAAGDVIFTVTRAEIGAECRCYADGKCPDGCISARAPACCSRDAIGQRVIACEGSIDPAASVAGAACGMRAGEACAVGDDGCISNSCQPVNVAGFGPALACCAPPVERPELRPNV